MFEFSLKISWVMLTLKACIQTAQAQVVFPEVSLNGLNCSKCTLALKVKLLNLDFIGSFQIHQELASKVGTKSGYYLGFGGIGPFCSLKILRCHTVIYYALYPARVNQMQATA